MLGQLDSNQRMQGSKPCALPLGDGPGCRRLAPTVENAGTFSERKTKSPSVSRKASAGWILGFEPKASRATIWRANQLRYTHHINFSLTGNVPEGIRTPDTRLRRPLLYPAELLAHRQKHTSSACTARTKRVMGIEPTCLAWKASVLPLNYTRTVTQGLY